MRRTVGEGVCVCVCMSKGESEHVCMRVCVFVCVLKDDDKGCLG